MLDTPIRIQPRVLLVDDDRDLIDAVSLRMRASGYETLTANDGRQAVASALSNHPDAIVMDVRMPMMDGLSALDALKRHGETRDIPIVMLSASLVDQQAALDYGARFFLKKPYHSQELVAAVRMAIGESGHQGGTP